MANKKDIKSSKDYQISDLSPHLFWDVDVQQLDWEKNLHFLIQRVLEYGVDRDWQILKQKFTIAQLAQISTELRTLDDKALHFIAAISHTPITQFRCYTTGQLGRDYSGY